MTGLSAEISAPPVAADQHAFSPSVGGLLNNIDNGGTLTDFLCHRWRECLPHQVGGVMAISSASTRARLLHLWALGLYA
jgi:hypothetical protein